jgi:hypothetical protein
MYRYTYMYIYINIYIDSTEKEITGCGSVFSIYSRRYLHTYIYIYIYVCIYKCVYIIHTYIYVYICVYIIYLYLYRERGKKKSFRKEWCRGHYRTRVSSVSVEK